MPENEDNPICDLCCFLRRMFFISWLTFVGAGVISLVAFKGLTALNGKYEDGVYFIGGHGTYHAVSEASFNVMLGVEKLVLLIFIAGMVAITLNNATSGAERHLEPSLFLGECKRGDQMTAPESD